MDSHSHYIPKFTTQGGEGRQQAACGRFVPTIAHRVEPSCHDCQRYLNSGPTPLTNVVVCRVTPLGDGRRMFNDWSTPNATADEFQPGVLTITSVADGKVIETFQPHRWRSASVIGSDGYPDFTIQNKHLDADQAWQGHVESRDRRTA